MSVATTSRNLWAALSVFAAGLLLVEANIASRRHYARWDWSSTESYTLSEATRKVVSGLDGPVTITTLLASGAPRRLELATLLESYAALSPQLEVQRIDPDRQPVEYLELTQSLSSFDGAPAGPLSRPAAVVERGERKAVVEQADLGTTDAQSRPVSRVEWALTRALVQVSSKERPLACFVTGHGEPSVDDLAPGGLRRLGEFLEANQVEVRRTPLDLPQPELDPCSLIAIVGPQRPVPKEHTALLTARAKAGAGVLIAVDPLLDRQAQIISSGLEPLAREVGVLLEASFIIETDPELRAPTGLGEAFFAVTKTHPVTEGLSTDQSRLDARAFFVGATALRPLPGAGTARLLETSASARTLSHLRLHTSSTRLTAPFAVGLASQATTKQNELPRKRRAVVLGSSHPLLNETLSDPAQVGNRILAEQALSWILQREALVSVPTRARASAGLRLTEDALSSLLRYVLFILPTTAAGLGAWFLWQRSRRERRARGKGTPHA